MKKVLFNKEEIANRKTRELIESFAKEIIARVDGYTINSIYIFGSSVQELIHNHDNSYNDIDLAIIVNETYTPGATPILPKEELSLLCESCSSKFGQTLGYLYNGIPQSPPGDINIDIIPLSKNIVDNDGAYVVIDLLNNDIIHLHGRNILKNKINTEPTKQQIIERIEIAENYIEREAKLQPEAISHLMDYSFKSIVFTLNILLDRSASGTDKKTIEGLCKQAELPPQLSSHLQSAYLYREKNAFQGVLAEYHKINKIIKKCILDTYSVNH